jgi:membrane protease YdiL (CAAX protease family)
VLTALCQAPGVLALRRGVAPSTASLLLMAIGSSGPTLVAILLSAAAGGGGGVRALLRRRGRPTWLLCLLALFLIPGAHLLGSVVLAVFGRHGAHHLVYLPLLPEQLAIAVVAPFGEEYGWRGYALPRLQALVTPLSASVVIGVVWTAWHVPAYLVPQASLGDLVLSMPALLAGSVIATWLYNASLGSMRVVLLLHLSAHLDNVFRARAAGDGLTPLLSTSVVLIAIAVALVASGRMRSASAVGIAQQ